MYIESVPNRSSPPAILLRESYREDGKVKKRTILNLTKWDPKIVEGLRLLLKGGTVIPNIEDEFEIVRTLPHGHVAAVLGTIRKIGLDRVIDPKQSLLRDRVLAMIVARIILPASKHDTASSLSKVTETSTLGEMLNLNDLNEDGLYAAMNWLLERQDRIKQRLAKRHLKEGCMVFYNLASVWLEGQHCPVAKHYHPRDGKKGKLQIEFGLLCDREGCPVSVEVFHGNASDQSTLASQIVEVREQFGHSRVVLVGDQMMLTESRIREEIKPTGIDWISELKGTSVRALVEANNIKLSLFDETDLVEITSDAYPGERLMVCRNLLPAEDPSHKHSEPTEVTEAGLDDLHVIRTSLPKNEIDGPETVRTYKHLNYVERAFYSVKTANLKLRPMFLNTEPQVRAQVLLCMLAYYVEWHMQQKLKPMLFNEEHLKTIQDERQSAKIQRKAQTKRIYFDNPAHSLHTLLDDLATLSQNTLKSHLQGTENLNLFTKPTPTQKEAFKLLGIHLNCSQ